MVTEPIIVCLPIADRRTSFTFYRDGLGFEPVGEVADDGARPVSMRLSSAPAKLGRIVSSRPGISRGATPALSQTLTVMSGW